MKAGWRTPGLGVALAIGLLGSACKAKDDRAELERSIAEALAKDGYEVKVACPAGRTRKAGDVFTCEATPADGTPWTITVTQKDDAGGVTWRLDGTLIDLDKIVTEVKPQLPPLAKVTCPSRVVQLKREGETTTCAVRDGDRDVFLMIRLEDAETRRVTTKLLQFTPDRAPVASDVEPSPSPR